MDEFARRRENRLFDRDRRLFLMHQSIPCGDHQPSRCCEREPLV